MYFAFFKLKKKKDRKKNIFLTKFLVIIKINAEKGLVFFDALGLL